MVIGILHTAIGLAEYRRTLREMVRDGMVGTVNGYHERGEILTVSLTKWLARSRKRDGRGNGGVMKSEYVPSARAAEMLVRKPVGEVFEAFVDPAITSRFWFTRSSGRLEAG